MPALAARFFIFFLDLPKQFTVGCIEFQTFNAIMVLVLILARKDAFALGIRQSNNPIGAGPSAVDMAVNVVIGLFSFFAFRKVTDEED